MGHYLSEMGNTVYDERRKAHEKRVKNITERIAKIRVALHSNEHLVDQKLREAEMWLQEN